MKQKSGCPVFDNAVDSLEHGIRMYRDTRYPNAHKYAVLAIYQAMELFLKDALWRVNPLLIYSNVDTPICEDARTVGYKDAVGRLSNIGIVLDVTARTAIARLQKRRNRIEHLEYHASDKDKCDMAEALKVLWDFVPLYLRTDGLTSFVEDNLCDELRQYIFDYDVLVADARRRMCVLTDREEVKPGDYTEVTVVECPECEHEMLGIAVKDGEDYCFFCQRCVPMSQCSMCGEYCRRELFEETSNCPKCIEQRLGRD